MFSRNATKSFILVCLVIFTFGLVGCSNLFNGTVSEVPEIPVTEISVEASKAADKIRSLSGRNRVVVTGNCDYEIISQIGNALKNNSDAKIILDLSGTNGLTSIPEEAFAYNSSLVEITLPESVTEIGWGAFNQCRSLKIVHSLGSVSELQNNTFGWCENLQSLTIPATVAYMNAPFAGCPNLTDIVIEEGNENFVAESGVIYTTDRTTIVAYPSASGELTINTSITRIADEAFNGSEITSVTIPSSVTEIGWSVFSSCEYLETVDIKANIKTIPDWAFGWCRNLKSITIPASVERIQNCAFIYCQKLTDISISGNNFIVKDNAIYTADETTLVAYPTASGSVEIPETVKTIGAGAFAGSLVDSITIHESVTTIESEAFRGCLAESITIPSSVTSIGRYNFNNCRNLKTVEIFAKVSVLPQSLFSYSQNLTSVTIPATVTSIEWGVFDGCENLRYVTYTGTQEMWNAISKQDGNSYLYNAELTCTGDFTEVPDIPVTEISVAASEAANTIYNLSGRNLVIVTGECSSETVSYIGNALKENQSAQILLDLSGTNGLTEIPEEAFAYNNSLVEITLPESVTEFGWGAFNQCRQLKTVHSLGSVSELQNNTFCWCENLQSLTIPATVTYMNAPFAGCSKLTDIVIEEGNANFIAENGVIYTTDRTTIVAYPSACGELTIDGSVSRIGASAFAGSRITSLIIPETVTEIEVNAFEGCNSLETVEIRANISTIPDGCFGECSNLQSITIPSSVQRIGSKAFVCCHKLTDIRIDGNNFIVEDGAIYSANGSTLIAYPSASGNVKVSDTVTSIAKEAFEGCLAESITIPSSVTSIGISSFHRCHNLETVEILANVSVIPQTMFAWSQNLTSVTIPATVTSIEGWAFNGCENLRYVTYTGTQEMWDAIDIIEDGISYLYNAELTCTGEYQEVPEIPVTEISVEASEAADKIRSLSGRNRVVVTGNCDYEIISQIGNALKENQFAQILLDLSGTEGLTWFLQNAFAYNNSLVEITLPDSVIDFGWGAFVQCRQLKTVHSLGSVSKLKEHTFEYCENLQSVTIPSTVETIESWSFHFCGLKQILIPASVTDIWFSAFQGCYNLMDIQVSSENTSYSAEGGILYNYDKTVLHSWPSANGDVTIPSNVTTIGRAAFRGCNLERLVIPEGVTTIESDAIKNCKNIVSLEIPASVTLIEGDFYDCPNLQIFVSEGNENYSSEDGILYNKDKTELIAYPSASGDLYLPETITTIGDWAFGCCPNLETVTIPASVTEIDYGAFNDCRNLTEVVFEEPDGWYATDPKSGEQKQFELTDPSTNAGLLVGDYCYYYWTKVEE